MSYDQVYQELREQLTDQEIAESTLIPADLTEQEKKENAEALRRMRFERLAQMTSEQKIYADLLQLRFKLEDYVNGFTFDPQRSFGYYLTEYIHIFRKTNKNFAEDINVHESRLSRMLKDKESPNIELMYRLERHSGELIPALIWWKLSSKKQEFDLVTNIELRNSENLKVKNAFSY